MTRTTASADDETATEEMAGDDTSQSLTNQTSDTGRRSDVPSSSETAGGAVSEWLSDAPGYDGTVVDATDRKRVTVSVGAASPNGPYAFAPAAVNISTGTTVVWEWTGEGGSHNVVAESGAFESDLVAEDGYTFEHAFDSANIYRYVCKPHESLGMKGAIIGE
ncbi:halocyanin domain-containing protein [Halococcus thailandensis]|nr:halocyanin domain-containing protein [Halococcus thailandensis]